MVAFVSVLAEFERRCEEVDRPIASSCRGPIGPLLLEQANIKVAAQAIAAYRCVQAELTPALEPDPFPRLLLEARHSAQGLKALRRRLAWRLHPDRAMAEGDRPSLSLSDVNAAIDAALASQAFSARE